MKDKRPTEEERAKASKYLAEAHSKTGHVFVDAPTGSVVLVDDAALEKKAPVKDPVDVTAGKHVCQIRLDGKTQTVEVVANPGQSVTVRFSGSGEKAPEVLEGQQQPTAGNGEQPQGGGGWSTGKTATVIALGVGAVGAIVAGVLWKIGQDSNQSDAQNITNANPGLNCPTNQNAPSCGRLNDLKSSYDSDRTLAVVGFAAGGVLAAGAVATMVLWPNEKGQPQKGSRIVPAVTAGGMSVQWVGHF